MKKTKSLKNLSGAAKGFTLIELMVVIAIIVILAGIGIGAYMKISKNTDKKMTAVRLSEIRNRLEDFARENNGIYPVGEDASSAALYNSLSGDYTGQGSEPTGPVYWPELNNKKNPGLVGVLQGKRVILDGFGNSYRYRSALDKNGRPVANVRNDGDYDLWSVGPDGEPSDLNVSGLLENEQTKDDIWR